MGKIRRERRRGREKKVVRVSYFLVFCTSNRNVFVSNSIYRNGKGNKKGKGKGKAEIVRPGRLGYNIRIWTDIRRIIAVAHNIQKMERLSRA